MSDLMAEVSAAALVQGEPEVIVWRQPGSFAAVVALSAGLPVTVDLLPGAVEQIVQDSVERFLDRYKKKWGLA